MRNKTFVLAMPLLVASLAEVSRAQVVTISIDESDSRPRARFGIGVNGGGSWTNFVGAILVDDPAFEGAADANGFARQGWPWYASGDLSASVETNGCPSPPQCQRVDVATAPASMNQGRADLPQAPLTMQARAGHHYRIKARVRSDAAGASVRLGLLDENWSGRYGDPVAVGTDWQVVETVIVPAQDHLLRGVSIRFEQAGSYWIDDVVAWDEDDYDPECGLSATFVSRLKELAPEVLRLGGLGVNGIPLESYIRHPWGLDYGPPGLQPDMDLNTFLCLCRELGAQPFITVPPAFSDSTHWQVGDLTYEVLDSIYEDHGNLVDYIGGDSSTAYGARREAAGYGRWDTQFELITFELGNELWGTPDDHWDMDINGNETLEQQMQNFVTYNRHRMTEMKSRPGWRGNMRVGFCGRSPDVWMGGWPGSYDGTVVPAIGDITDFSTIDMYYGAGQPSDGDDAIYAALFASAEMHRRQITEMREAFRQANGGNPIATVVYEGNATWGGYEPDLHNPSALYYKEVSLGAAVSLVDNYAAANAAGVDTIAHFHYGGNVWGATGPYPQVLRKPAFYAMKLLARHTDGELAGCNAEGGGSWDDALTGTAAVPYVGCYPYVQGSTIHLLVVNRHLSEPRTVELGRRVVPIEAVWLRSDDINANNETAENVTLETEKLSGMPEEPFRIELPPHSAVVVKLLSGEDEQPVEEADGADGGGDATDGGSEGDTAQVDTVADGTSGNDGDELDEFQDGGTRGDGDGATGKLSGSCGCASGSSSGTAILAVLALASWCTRRRRASE